MIERGAGQPSWPLSPYEVSVSYGQPGAAGQGADWFGPLAPITPLAPPEVSGRQWDYPSGYNLATTPRIYEPVSFHTLRGLADGYDLLRLVIETRKDQVARLVWNIGPRNKQPGADPRLATLRQFFARPDGLHSFGDWLRLLLEELFVIDAPTLYLQRDRGGRLTALLPLDGATIKPVIDDWGRTPQPYAENGATVYPVAYQQVLKGYPAVNYSLRDIIYRPRNLRVNHAYGLSPVEQIITSVNIALRRQMYLLDYFTQGNIPDSLIGVPENWTPDQIASYQKYWDAYFDGDLGRRRRAKFVPGGVAKTFIQTKEPDLKGPFDEWLARIVCFAFSISPQALTQQVNRATAQTQKELSEEEGLAPVLAWVKDLIDQIIAREFAAPDLEFTWSAEPAIDPQAQEAILSSYTSKGIITINEARAALGRDPYPDAAANRPMTLTGQGYVALGAQAVPAKGVKKDNPYHDERGRFTTADGAASAASGSAKPQQRVAQADIPEEENRGAEEPSDPLAEIRGQEWAKSIATLRALDPRNPNLSYATAPDWVPTDQNIADINAEIARVAVKRVTDYVMPGGNLIGARGGGGDVRNAPGGARTARATYDYLSVGGTPYAGPYPGEMTELPGSAGYVGYRDNDQGIPTVDVNVPSAHIKVRFHYQK